MYMQVEQLLFQELLFIIYYTILSYYNVKRKYYLSLNSAVCFWYYKIVIYAAFVYVSTCTWRIMILVILTLAGSKELI